MDISGNGYVGGFCADNSASIENSFWDISTTGQNSSDGGDGKITAEMKTCSTFYAAGWDIPDTWHIDESEGSPDNQGYPSLTWQGLNHIARPVVTTQAVSNINLNSATGNGEITYLASLNPSSYGVCWSTAPAPDTLDNRTNEGIASATGQFTTEMSGLSENTTYHVRAYAKNDVDIYYGSEVTFATSANSLPTGGNDEITIKEDVNYSFQSENFTYSDSNGDPFNGIKITALETKGSLSYFDNAVSINDAINDITELEYSPANDSSGSPYTSFEFQVFDGNAYSTSSYTMTINISPLDDAPRVDEGFSDINVSEDTSDSVFDISNLFRDPDNDDSKITKSITNISDSSLVTATLDNDTLILDYQKDQNGQVVITMRAMYNGKIYDYTFDVNINPVNDKPYGENSMISTLEDSMYVFQQRDFVFHDVDSNSFAGIKIMTEETAGKLVYDSSDVVANGFHPDVSQLVFTPLNNETASPYSSFTYKLKDNAGAYSETAYTMLINVTEINDPPLVQNPLSNVIVKEDASKNIINLSKVFTDPDDNDEDISKTIVRNSDTTLVVTKMMGNSLILDYQKNQNGEASIIVGGRSNGNAVTDTFSVTVKPINDKPQGGDGVVNIEEESAYNFQPNDFPYSDIEGHKFDGIKFISVPSIGRITTYGQAVSASKSYYPDVTKLKFTPELNGSGKPYTTFTFKVRDEAGAFSDSIYTMEINVVEVDDPLQVQNMIPDLAVNEDANPDKIDLSATFTDPDSDDANIIKDLYSYSDSTLVTVSIVNDTLILNYQHNQSGQAEIIVLANSNNITTTDTFMVTVNPVNDAPISANSSITTDEDQPYEFSATDFIYNDVENDSLNAIQIVALPEKGYLKYNGENAALDKNYPDLTKLVYTPLTNESGSP